jgi:hypothetical protein
MTSLKEAIFAEVRKYKPELAELTYEQLDSSLFYHNHTLRLNYTGFVLLRKIFTVYSFEIPITIKPKHRYGLSKMSYPYFFTKSRLILFSESDALMIKLQGGIERFLENCANFDK